MNSLTVDPIRWAMRHDSATSIEPRLYRTSIYVRALNPDTQRWDNIDIAYLDTASLLEWLTSRGGDNPWAENAVLLLLGHITQGGPHRAIE